MSGAGEPRAGASTRGVNTAAAVSAIIMLGGLTATLWRVYGPGDFRYFFETADVWRRSGRYLPALADGANLSLPHVALAFVPLTTITLPAAWLAWQWLNLAALGLVWALLPVRVPPGFTAVLCVTPAVLSQVVLGQAAAAMAMLVTVAWLDTMRGRWVRAGLALGIAIAMKPFLVPVACWLAVSRAGRVAASALATAAAVVLAGMWALSAAAYAEWWEAAWSASWTAFELNVSVFGWLARLELVETPIPWLIGCALVAGVTARAVWGRQGAPAWVAVLAACILLSPLGWAYYELLFVGPLIVGASAHRELRAVAWALWIPPAVSVAGVTAALIALLAVWATAARLSRASGSEPAANHG